MLSLAAALCLLAGGNKAEAQDIHFSQLATNPILLNPAYSGFFNGTGRFGIVYRNQWANVGEAFNTFAASAEVALMRRRRQRDGLSLGIWAYSDRAGELRYGSSAATAALSYYLALDRDGSLFLSAGVELGMGRSGYDASRADLYDNSEVLLSQHAAYPLIGAGVALYLQPNDDFYLKLGLSGRNLNRPNISYLSLSQVFLERKVNLFAQAEYRFGNSLALLPVALLQWQQPFHEWVGGCDLKWYISENRGEQLSASVGMRYRWRDAFYMEYAFEWNSLLFCLNYDMNLSQLTPASHTYGAFELELVYRIRPRNTIHRKAMPCPVI